MVDISAIAGTVSALKGAVDLTKIIVGLHDAKAIQAKVIELNSMILEAQRSTFAAQDERSTLVERIRTLEKEVADLKAWGAEKETYELNAVDIGAFAYTRKKTVQTTEPPHWLCAACYQAGQKSFLQFHARENGGREHFYKCDKCPSIIRVDWHVSPKGDTRAQTAT